MHKVTPTLALSLCLLPFLPQDPPAGKPQEPTAAAGAPTPGKMDAAMLQKLAWLAGTWTSQDGETTTEEHWRPLQGTTLLGSAHTFTNKRTVFFEYARIALQKGTIAYIAQPGGAAPTEFPLVAISDTAMTFEQAGHDYPQRIRYERTANGMTATISLLDGKRAQSFVFTKG